MKIYIKKIIACCFALIILSAAAYAQPTNARGWYERADIEDVEVGWIKMLHLVSRQNLSRSMAGVILPIRFQVNEKNVYHISNVMVKKP
ncbi:MAG: hypothetical protein KA821_08580 [Chitinophagaceae bacterium]|nr:hypothetical protein [Chitinophagaceae bacterium]